MMVGYSHSGFIQERMGLYERQRLSLRRTSYQKWPTSLNLMSLCQLLNKLRRMVILLLGQVRLIFIMLETWLRKVQLSMVMGRSLLFKGSSNVKVQSLLSHEHVGDLTNQHIHGQLHQTHFMKSKMWNEKLINMWLILILNLLVRSYRSKLVKMLKRLWDMWRILSSSLSLIWLLSSQRWSVTLSSKCLTS